MSKLFSRASVTSASLTGANLKATLTALWDAMNSGGFSDSPRTTVTTTSTLTITQCGLLLIDATSGNITLTLPASGTAADDSFYLLRRIDSTANTVSVLRSGADTLEGSAGVLLPANSTTEMQLPGGSSNWRVIGISGPTAAASLLAIGAAPLDSPAFTTKVTAPKFTSGTASFSVATATWINMVVFTAAQPATWLVSFSVLGSGDAPNYGTAVLVMTDSSTASLVYLNHGAAGLDAQLVGLQLQARQGSGTTQTIVATYTRLG